MRFLNPKTDFAFKKIFGSAESSDILISLLNAILQLQGSRKIDQVTILDPYLSPVIAGMKDTYLDVRAVNQQGHSYIIEMQVLNVEGFEKRVLYNACKAYSGQLNKGEGYSTLNDVIAITFTDFIMFDDSALQSSVVNTFQLKANNGLVYSDDLSLIFAELPKFKKNEQQLESVLDKWFYFLQMAETLDVVPTALKEVSAIVHAFNIANKAGLSEQELDDQERREIFIQDQRGALTLARKQGHQEGHQKGHKIGHEKGHQEGHKIGHEKGHKEGAGQTMLANINEILHHRFGQSADEISTRLAPLADKPELLKPLLSHALNCASVEAFLRQIKELE